MNKKNTSEPAFTIEHSEVRVNNVRLHIAASGPRDGIPVFLLHGFPDAWFGWEYQIKFLARNGFRVIAPDQRGYNLSEKPTGIKHYELEQLTSDIVSLADHFKYDTINLAGHDWGAAVCWNVATRYPKRVKNLAVLNVPHPTVMTNYLKRHPSQMLKSWYIFVFQIPKIAEILARLGNWRLLISAFPKYLPSSTKNRYREAWSQFGAITGMINWYRAAFRLAGRRTSSTNKVASPTLIIWGKNDRYLSYAMAELSLEYCQHGKLVTLETASHWVLLDEPDEVSKLLLNHFQ